MSLTFQPIKLKNFSRNLCSLLPSFAGSRRRSPSSSTIPRITSHYKNAVHNACQRVIAGYVVIAIADKQHRERGQPRRDGGGLAQDLLGVFDVLLRKLDLLGGESIAAAKAEVEPHGAGLEGDLDRPAYDQLMSNAQHYFLGQTALFLKSLELLLPFSRKPPPGRD